MGRKWSLLRRSVSLKDADIKAHEHAESIISRLTEKSMDETWSYKDRLTEAFNAFATESPERSTEALLSDSLRPQLISHLDIDEAAFARMFGRAFPWAESIVPEVKSVLFGLLRSVSRVPFYHPEVSNSLDLGAFIRAMAILSLPSNGPMSEPARFDSVNSMRKRSLKDQHRVLFQNLASEHSEFAASHNQNTSAEPTVHPKAPWLSDLDSEDVQSFWYIDVSSENPYLTDLIDTLTSIQPCQRRFASVARVFFKDIAERFLLPQTPLSRLRISRSDVLYLVEFFLTFQQAKATESGSSYVPSIDIKEKAVHLVERFASSGQALLGWDEFGSIFAAREVVHRMCYVSCEY